MLTAQLGTRSCNSCRSKLLFLFEYGLSGSTCAGQLARIPRHSLPSRRLDFQRPLSRTFSTAKRQFDKIHEGSESAAPQGEANNIEEVVRNAKATFGDTLPKDYLSEEEYLLYERLYGPPIRETRADDFGLLNADGSELPEREDEGKPNKALLRENSEGELEEIEFESNNSPQWGLTESTTDEAEDSGPTEALSVGESQESPPGTDTVQIRVKSQRAVDAIMRLQRDMDVAFSQPHEEEAEKKLVEEEEYQEEENEDEENEDDRQPLSYLGSDSKRTHPHTQAGRFGTSPSTIILPRQQFVTPITELLSRTKPKHLSEAAEKAFGGQGLPHSAATPSLNWGQSQKHIGLEAGQHNMSEIEADAYLAAVLPGIYTAAMSTIVEVRKRLGASWIRGLLARKGGEGPRILDAGAGGAGIIAWRQVLAAELDMMRSEGLLDDFSPIPGDKSTVLTGSSTLRHRMTRLLDNTTFLPRLPDYIHSANSENLLDGSPAHNRKSFDIIIAPHLLLPVKEDHKRKAVVQKLWSMLDPNGGVLILVEKGTTIGYEAIAGARALLLKHHISSPGATHVPMRTESDLSEEVTKEPAMIIAPCTNHSQCPMYKIEGRTPGRKDFCYFSQRFERPAFLQTLIGAKHRNHEDIRFSYVAVQRGVDLRQTFMPNSLHEHDALLDQGEAVTQTALAGFEGLGPKADSGESTSGAAFSTFSLPRVILPPLKRQGHVTLDLCTPAGNLERWTVPKSFSKQAYRDARKSSHGDLWALGGKTRTVRVPRLGKRNPDGTLQKKIKSKDKNGNPVNKKKKKSVFEIEMGSRGMEGMRELIGGRVDGSQERRTKRGRAIREPKDIKIDDIEDDDDDDM